MGDPDVNDIIEVQCSSDLITLNFSWFIFLSWESPKHVFVRSNIARVLRVRNLVPYVDPLLILSKGESLDDGIWVMRHLESLYSDLSLNANRYETPPLKEAGQSLPPRLYSLLLPFPCCPTAVDPRPIENSGFHSYL